MSLQAQRDRFRTAYQNLQLLPLLTEEQALRLPRVRLKREHARLLGDELVREWMNPATQTNLTDVFEQTLIEVQKPESGIEPPTAGAAWACAVDRATPGAAPQSWQGDPSEAPEYRG